MALTSEVVLSIEMVSFPVGGRMSRMAWGSTMSLRDAPLVMPSEWAASLWPSSTEMMPARTISDM